MVSTTKQIQTPEGDGNPIVDLVIKDLLERKEFGTKKYGEPLKAFNGRSSILDVYQEILDLCVYMRQLLEELSTIKFYDQMSHFIDKFMDAQEVLNEKES